MNFFQFTSSGWIEQGILYYFVWLNGIYTLQLLVACYVSYNRYKEIQAENANQVLQSNSLPPLTFLVPAYNESKTITITLQNLLTLSYQNKQIILINDGSKDNTLEFLINTFDLIKVPPSILELIPTQPILSYYRSKKFLSLLVVDKKNGGKADAVNAGINACITPLFVVLDSDTLIDDKSLNNLIRPCLTEKNTVITGASIRLVNGCQVIRNRVIDMNFPSNILAGIQAVEYLRAFFLGRLGWNWTHGCLIVSGAFGVFNTEIARKIGGFDPNSIGEDMEFVVRLHRYMHETKQPYRITFIQDPVARTEAPEDLKSLAKQRQRWHIGLVQTLWKHRIMFFNPKYGVEGLVTIPFFVFGEMLAPLVEITGYGLLAYYLIFGVVNWTFFWTFLFLSWGFTTFLSTITILVSEEITYRAYPTWHHVMKMLGVTLLENCGYRQMTVIWRLQGLFSAFKKKQKWGDMVRKGYNTKTKL